MDIFFLGLFWSNLPLFIMSLVFFICMTTLFYGYNHICNEDVHHLLCILRIKCLKILCLSCYSLFLFAKKPDYLWIANISFSNSSTWCLKLFLPYISVYFLIWPFLIIQISLKYLFVLNIYPFFFKLAYFCLNVFLLALFKSYTTTLDS